MSLESIESRRFPEVIHRATLGEPVVGRHVLPENALPASPGSVLEPDLGQADRFLTLLDEEAVEFTFVTLDDDQTRKESALTRQLIGTFAEHQAELIRLNLAGAGVFVTINATDGNGRAGFVDLDGAPLEPVLACELEPRLIVETSPRHYHAYWFVEQAVLDKFPAVQGAIAARFGGGAALKEPAVERAVTRLRLPREHSDPCDKYDQVH